MPQVRLARGFEIAEKAYAGHPRRLLCPGGQRRGEEAARHGTEERSPLHYSIT